MKHRLFVLFAAVCALAAFMFASSLVGASSTSPLDILTPAVDGSGRASTARTIWWELRVPRVLTGATVGGCLAAAGVGFQGLFRNPLAEPYVIGASSGAALGVSLVIVWDWHRSLLGVGATTAGAMIGAVAVVAIVLTLGLSRRAASTSTLLLAGVVMSAFISAAVSGIMFWNDQKAVVILSWLMGSLADSHWGTWRVSAVVGVIACGAIWGLSRPLDAHALGDVSAASLGLDIVWFRTLLIGAAGMATAAAVASAGVIGFVGLISPHVARLTFGHAHAVLLPASIVIGAVLMVLADLIARVVIAPAELPVGIVTAIIGCPLFLWLLRHGDSRVGGSEWT